MGERDAVLEWVRQQIAMLHRTRTTSHTIGLLSAYQAVEERLVAAAPQAPERSEKPAR